MVDGRSVLATESIGRGGRMSHASPNAARDVIAHARALREQVGPIWHDRVTESLYSRAARIAKLSVQVTGRPRVDWDLLADRLLTGRLLG